MKRVVVIGGGTGVFSVLSGLKHFPYELHAIVSMADDGGSTGVLREEFGMLPPGDIRRALVALSDADNKILSELFNFRFAEDSSLKGHSLGNLLLTALEKITGSFQTAIREAVKILNVKGDVIPVTLESTRLYAQLENGKVIKGETNIDIPKHDGRLKIKRIFLKPAVKSNPDAIAAIKKADFIILGPGDLYTSILPNLVVGDIAKAIVSSSAKKIYIVNIMNKFGETFGFSASDFLRVIQEHLGRKAIDYCVVNTEKAKRELLARYQKEKDDFVPYDKSNFRKDIFNREIKNVFSARLLREGEFLRHDPEKLARLLARIIEGRIDGQDKRKTYSKINKKKS